MSFGIPLKQKEIEDDEQELKANDGLYKWLIVVIIGLFVGLVFSILTNIIALSIIRGLL